jgi:aerobic carbon-monoxide dehydrogenase large subunit
VDIRRSSIGRRIPSLEAPRLLQGMGRYVADIQLPDMLHAVIVRSPVAHGRVVSVDTAGALRMPEVRAVVTAQHLGELGVDSIPVGAVVPEQMSTTYPALAEDKVWYAGQPLAVVVASSQYSAEDAAELVRLEIEELPSITDTLAALRPDSPLLNEAWGTNIAARYVIENGDVDGAFNQADHVISERFRIHRHAGCPIETRGAVATYDPIKDETTAWISTQAPHHTAALICEVCGWSQHRLRVVAPDVGGAFGTKEPLQPEELIVCVLARHLRTSIRWIEDRREHFLSTVHAREQVWDIELAADSDGRLLGARGRLVSNVGGHLSNNGIAPALKGASMFPGPYDFDNFRLEVLGVLTNKVPAGAYRGFGGPQAAFVMERLVDELAVQARLDRAELRRRAFIRPEAFPRTTASGRRYDSGNYAEALETALQLIDYQNFPALQRELRAQGRHLGLGIASFVMVAGLAPSSVLGASGAKLGGHQSALVRMDPTGKVTLFVGTSSQGQGHATTLAQVCADVLCVDPQHDVKVTSGDSVFTPDDPSGAVGSRVASVGGSAVVMASTQLRQKLLRIAAHLLEASESDIELADGRAFVRGAEARGVGFHEVAMVAHLGHDLPEGLLPGLAEQCTHEPENSNYPYATHAGVVEVDVETGQLRILRYVVANDCGTVINPMIVEGQIRGGVSQGIGGAFLEHLSYDADGQCPTSFMDYLLPLATDLPDIEIHLSETPAPHVPGGMKGVGETGAIAPMAVVGNAVADALRPMGVKVTDLPLDGDRVWRLVRDAPGSS